MKIIYQGVHADTSAADLAGLLREQGLNAQNLLIEFNGNVLTPGAEELADIVLNHGDSVNLFQIVPGG